MISIRISIRKHKFDFIFKVDAIAGPNSFNEIVNIKSFLMCYNIWSNDNALSLKEVIMLGTFKVGIVL